jgi:hypothetical protein
MDVAGFCDNVAQWDIRFEAEDGNGYPTPLI